MRTLLISLIIAIIFALASNKLGFLEEFIYLINLEKKLNSENLFFIFLGALLMLVIIFSLSIIKKISLKKK